MCVESSIFLAEARSSRRRPLYCPFHLCGPCASAAPAPLRETSSQIVYFNTDGGEQELDAQRREAICSSPCLSVSVVKSIQESPLYDGSTKTCSGERLPRYSPLLSSTLPLPLLLAFVVSAANQRPEGC